MKKKFAFVVGLFALSQVIYKFVTCINCEETILLFTVSGLVFILFWTVLSVLILYDVYKVNWAEKKKDNL